MNRRILLISLIVFCGIFSGWPRIQEAQAQITLRGTPKLTGGTNGADITLTFDTGAGAPQTGDVVIFFGGSGSDGVGTTKGPSTPGYTLIDITNGADVQVGAWYKVMESTPDLTVVGLGGGDTGDAVAYGAYVIDGTTLDAAIFDQTTTKVGQITGVPDAPAILTQTAGAMVIALAGGHLTDATPGTITGYTNDVTAAPNDTDDITLAAATKIVASPTTEDPAAWSTWTSANYIAITIALKPAPPVANVTQTHYRFRNDDGSESAATWRALEDATTKVDRKQNIRLRFAIANTGGGSANNYQYLLEYSTSTGGPWTAVPVTPTAANEHFEMTLTANYIDNDPTTAQLTGTGTFAAGKCVEDPSNKTVSYNLSAAYYTEFEYCLQATNYATDAGTYYFRLSNNGTALNTYSVYPQFVIAAEFLYAFWLDVTSIKYCVGDVVSNTWGTTTYTLASSLDSPGYLGSNYSDDSKIGVIWRQGSSSPYKISYGIITAPTLVDLVSFNAIGYDNKVWVKWKTASEMNNAGFNIYRSLNRNEGYTKLNYHLIPGLGTSAIGKEYIFWDDGVTNGNTYYYKLEDVEFNGKSTMHGPVEAHPGRDSDGDGMTDDWENYYGLNPFDPNDAHLDPDNDGLTNLEEFLQGTDPTPQPEVGNLFSVETTPGWIKNILLVADDQHEPYEAMFESISNSLLKLIPSDYQVSKIYLSSYSAPEEWKCKRDIIKKINAGTLLLNYVGHGSVQQWADENIFDSTDIASLTNQAMLPFIVAMTCANGYFVYPDPMYFCLAESLLLAKDKGAIACFMPAGISEPEMQKLLDEGLFNTLFDHNQSPSLGLITTLAKLNVFENAGDASKNIIQTYILFGDPGLELHRLSQDAIPPRVVAVSPSHGSIGVDISSNISIKFNKPMDKITTANAFSISPQVTSSFAWDANTLIYSPSVQLAYDTEYIVTLDATKAQDIAGNSLDGNSNGISEGSPVDDFQWSFITQSLLKPLLWARPVSLAFGSQDNLRSLRITNKGEAVLRWSITSDKDWISVSPTKGTTTEETDIVEVGVDRTELTPGVHRGIVKVKSNGGNQDIAVEVTVAKGEI